MFSVDIENEFNKAREKYPDYHSFHEGYAVLKEEIEELEERFDNMRIGLDGYWQAIRQKNVKPQTINYMLEQGDKLYEELIQVMAVLARHRFLFK